MTGKRPGVRGQLPSAEHTLYTVQAWIKMDNVNDFHGVVTKRNCCNDFTMFQWSMQTSPSGLMSWAVNTGQPNLVGSGDAIPVPLGEWINYTGTFDGTTICLYRNGLLVSSNLTSPDSIVAMSWPVIIVLKTLPVRINFTALLMK